MSQSMPSFADLLDSAQQSAVHLEMRDSYGVTTEADALARWKETGEVDDDPESPYWAPWTRLIRRSEDPAAARLCAEAFEAVWQRAIPHGEYKIS